MSLSKNNDHSPITLLEVLSTQKLTPPFAVAMNRRFVPKSHYAETLIHEGDQIEVVNAVTGG